MNKKFVAAVAAFAALCGMVSAPANAAEEDGSGQAGLCYWDSARMGNGRGVGLYIYRDGVLVSER